MSLDIPPIHEIWSIPTWQRTLVEDAFSPFTEEEFTQALLKEGVELHYSEESFENVEDPVSAPLSGKRVLLFSEGSISIFLPERIRAPYHLEIVLEKEKNTILDVDAEEMISLHQTIQKIAVVFRDCGISDFVVSIPHDFSQRNRQFTIEIIGERPDAEGMLHKLDVADRQHWVHRFPIDSPPQLNLDTLNTQESRNHLAQQLSQKMEEPSLLYTANETPTPKEPWIQSNRYEGSYKLYLLESIEKLLRKAHISLKKESHAVPQKSDEVRDVHKKGNFCPFCTDKILAKESVLRNDTVAILYNTTSSHPRGHFLLTTATHKARYEDLNQEEIRVSHLALQQFVKVMHEEFDWTNWGFTIVQNGKNVNQTVPHFHYKIEQGDRPLPYLIYQILRDQGDTRKVSDQELNEVVSSVKEKLI